MKWTFPILAALWVFSPVALAPAQEGNKTETEHLVIIWSEGTIRSEIETAKTKGERFYSAIRDILGHEPESKITIRLRGAAEQPNGRRGYPHVDSWGRINLFRFEPSGRSYFSALAHEMVHSFRFRRSQQVDWFFEEGFAEFVARASIHRMRDSRGTDFPLSWQPDSGLPMAKIFHWLNYAAGTRL